MGLSPNAATSGGASLYGSGSASASGSSSVGVSAGSNSSSVAPGNDETTSSVQFMWQPLSDINYPTITLLASFKVSGSIDLLVANAVTFKPPVAKIMFCCRS